MLGGGLLWVATGSINRLTRKRLVVTFVEVKDC
jgi:hypothetical protein